MKDTIFPPLCSFCSNERRESNFVISELDEIYATLPPYPFAILISDDTAIIILASNQSNRKSFVWAFTCVPGRDECVHMSSRLDALSTPFKSFN